MDTQNDAELEKAARTVSRRDFLKRAGKEAVSTTVSMLPAAKIARVLAESPALSEPSTDADLNTEPDTAPKPRAAWWGGLAVWRRNRETRH